MKKTELKAYIREEIISTLNEADAEDIKAQQDLNKELDLTKTKADAVGQALSEDDDTEPSAADIKKGDSIAKIATKLSANEKEMKTVVNQWKKAEGAEKEEFLKRLKALTKIKKELEGLL
jgi:siderophore synthetase component